MPNPPLHHSLRSRQTQDQPISYFMQQAVENPRLISLAAGLVDAASLPALEMKEVLDEILADPALAQAALQYGTTQGQMALREKILARCLRLDGLQASDLSITVNDVLITTGSQQLLYLLGEALFDPGDIVITEAPSYFVYQGTLTSLGVRTLAVPMDEKGMITDALEEMLQRLDRTGELDRVRLIYTIDYFQNPTGLTLSGERRGHLLDLARRFSRKNRILILEDAAYRELRFEGKDLPTIKSLDRENSHVILTMTFSKPWAPGLKTGYGLLPHDLMKPVLRFKGNHDFGSSNFNQFLMERILQGDAFERHIAQLCQVYRSKRDILLDSLEKEFPRGQGFSWTRPEGGMYVWLACPANVATGPHSPFMQACIREGVLYVPGKFCYVNGENGPVPDNEARLCYGVASPEQLREAACRLGRVAGSLTRSHGLTSVPSGPPVSAAIG